MKTTKAKLEAILPGSIFDDEPISLDEKVHLIFEGDIVLEDWNLFRESLDYMNEHMSEQSDDGDHMLALITWAIHKAYEDRTGKPFVLRMDRVKN